jgi:hypothetical protein
MQQGGRPRLGARPFKADGCVHAAAPRAPPLTPAPVPTPHPQHDVELVHAIEGIIGRELAPHDMPEDEVLKGITRVYAARKRAALDAIELDKKGGAGAAAARRKASYSAAAGRAGGGAAKGGGSKAAKGGSGGGKAAKSGGGA